MDDPGVVDSVDRDDVGGLGLGRGVDVGQRAEADGLELEAVAGLGELLASIIAKWPRRIDICESSMFAEWRSRTSDMAATIPGRSRPTAESAKWRIGQATIFRSCRSAR